jgi:tetratricopeptide (TPR) repeat protein
MKQLRIYLLFFTLTGACSVYSQQIESSEIKFLEKKVNQSKNSGEKLKFLLQLFPHYEFSDTIKARKINDECVKIAEKLNHAKLIAEAYNHKGFLYEDKGDLKNALIMYGKVLKIGLEIHDARIISNSYNNIGVMYKIQGDFAAALSNYHKCLKIELKAKDSNAIAGTYVNIGEIYRGQRDYKKALLFFYKALKLWKNTELYYQKAVVLNDIGLALEKQGKITEARKALLESFVNYKKANMKGGMATSLMNISLTFNKNDYPDSAVFYSLSSLKYAQNSGDSLTIMISYNGLGEALITVGKNSEALQNFKISYHYFKKNELIENLKDASYGLSKVYYRLGNYKFAHQFLNEYVSLSRKILNSERTEQLAEMEARFQSVQKDKLLVENKAEIKLKKNQQSALFIGLFIVLLSTIFIYNRFRVTRKQKIIIESQKHLVEEKNKEILDSITYAKRIQSAILPQPKLVKEYFKDSFILYKPKDIVAGDFYWFEVIDDIIFFAAADCTGHGVPGAMVSVVCHNALNRSVKEYGLKKPGEILDKTREIVVSEFEKSDEDVKDGMDISLASLRFRAEKKNENQDLISIPFSPHILSWSGAHNPLWILRNNEIIEYKADKQPIGKFIDPKPFTTHEIELHQNDLIYIFTDGLQDQFGGSKGKKLKASLMKDILLYKSKFDRWRIS